MVKDTVQAPYSLQMERWLRREFYLMENQRERYDIFETVYIYPFY